MGSADFGVGSPAYVALRAVIAGATILLLGAFALRFIVIPLASREREGVAALLPEVERRSRQWLLVASSAIAVATVLRLFAQHVAIFGADESPTTDTLLALLRRSAWGYAWWSAAIGSAISLAALLWSRPSRTRSDATRDEVAIRWRALGVGTALVVVSQPLSGHAAAAANAADAVALQFLHIVGAGGWIGTLAALVFVAIPATGSASPTGGDEASRDDLVGALVRAFSPVALGFVLLLSLTGVLAAWRALGGVAALFESEYGRVLLLKLSLLSVAVGAGAYNWKRVLPTLGAPAATARLNRSARVELAAAVVVVLVTAVLVATPTVRP